MRDELVEALKDPTVATALANSLGLIIAQAVQTAIIGLQARLDVLETTVSEVKEGNLRLRPQIQAQGGRLDELEIYSRAHNLITRGVPESSYSERATASASSSTASTDSHVAVAAMILQL